LHVLAGLRLQNARQILREITITGKQLLVARIVHDKKAVSLNRHRERGSSRFDGALRKELIIDRRADSKAALGVAGAYTFAKQIFEIDVAALETVGIHIRQIVAGGVDGIGLGLQPRKCYRENAGHKLLDSFPDSVN
jgi:hypothetical protein